MALTMPRRAVKTVYLYAPVEGSPEQVTAQYESTRGRAIATIQGALKPISNDKPVVLTVGELPGGLPATREGDRIVYTALSITPAKLPPHHEGLEMFDAIVITPPPMNAFSRDQVQALSDWVLRGGILAVDTSRRSDALISESFTALLPFVPLQGAQGDLGLFESDVRYATGRVEGGEVLLQAQDLPLVVRRPHGLGSINCFAVDPGSSGFKKYPGMQTVWGRIFDSLNLHDQRRRNRNAPDAQFYDEELRKAAMALVDTGPRTSVRLGIVVLLTALYALAVGPFDYFLIRYLRRPKLTWITFPAMVAAFTLAAFYGAKAYVGGELATKSRQRIVFFDDQDVGIRYDLSSVFVPAGADYTIEHGDGNRLKLLQEGFQATPQPVRFYGHEGRVVQRIPIWTRRVYSASDTQADLLNISFELYAEGNDLMARIRNGTDLTLRRNAVAYRKAIFTLPNFAIAPGTTQDVRVASLDQLDRSNSTLWDDRSQAFRTRFGTRLALVGADVIGLVGMREFNLAGALDQGAAVWLTEDAGSAPCPVTVNGRVRPERSDVSLQIVTYEGVNL
jgi:hypothetical protein